jgi:hypothetical protein
MDSPRNVWVRGSGSSGSPYMGQWRLLYMTGRDEEETTVRQCIKRVWAGLCSKWESHTFWIGSSRVVRRQFSVWNPRLEPTAQGSTWMMSHWRERSVVQSNQDAVRRYGLEWKWPSHISRCTASGSGFNRVEEWSRT